MKIRTTFAFAVASLTIGVPAAMADPGRPVPATAPGRRAARRARPLPQQQRSERAAGRARPLPAEQRSAAGDDRRGHAPRLARGATEPAGRRRPGGRRRPRLDDRCGRRPRRCALHDPRDRRRLRDPRAAPARPPLRGTAAQARRPSTQRPSTGGPLGRSVAGRTNRAAARSARPGEPGCRSASARGSPRGSAPSQHPSS